MNISIVIPAYNEEKRIAPTIRELVRELTALQRSFEIVVVDDGSSDGTVALVDRLSEQYPQVRCIPCPQNRGKGHAVRVGMLGSYGEIRVMTDADGSMPATELGKLLLPLENGEAEIAIGSRYAKGASSDANQPRWRVLWSRAVNQVIQRSLVPGVFDTQCGFKAFGARAAVAVFSRATIDGWAFDLEALGLASRLGLHICEVGVHWTDDPDSRVNPIQDFVAVVREFWVIRGNFRRERYGKLSAPPARLAAGTERIVAQCYSI